MITWRFQREQHRRGKIRHFAVDAYISHCETHLQRTFAHPLAGKQIARAAHVRNNERSHHLAGFLELRTIYLSYHEKHNYKPQKRKNNADDVVGDRSFFTCTFVGRLVGCRRRLSCRLRGAHYARKKKRSEKRITPHCIFVQHLPPLFFISCYTRSHKINALAGTVESLQIVQDESHVELTAYRDTQYRDKIAWARAELTLASDIAS